MTPALTIVDAGIKAIFRGTLLLNNTEANSLNHCRFLEGKKKHVSNLIQSVNLELKSTEMCVQTEIEKRKVRVPLA